MSFIILSSYTESRDGTETAEGTGGGFVKEPWRFLVLLTALLLVGCAAASTTPRQQSLWEEERKLLAERWGIEVKGIRLSAAGHMLDFRYRVIDPEKASSLVNRQTKAYLVDEASDVKLTVPITRIGPLRQTSVRPQANKEYFILFGNIGNVVKSGSKVTVVIGDFNVEHLTVE